MQALIYMSLTVKLVSQKGLVFLPHKCIQSRFKAILLFSPSASEKPWDGKEAFCKEK